MVCDNVDYNYFIMPDYVNAYNESNNYDSTYYCDAHVFSCSIPFTLDAFFSTWHERAFIIFLRAFIRNKILN
mgnify:CR=1 FL=1